MKGFIKLLQACCIRVLERLTLIIDKPATACLIEGRLRRLFNRTDHCAAGDFGGVKYVVGAPRAGNNRTGQVPVLRLNSCTKSGQKS
jgi:hypothetical protein